MRTCVTTDKHDRPAWYANVNAFLTSPQELTFLYTCHCISNPHPIIPHYLPPPHLIPPHTHPDYKIVIDSNSPTIYILVLSFIKWIHSNIQIGINWCLVMLVVFLHGAGLWSFVGFSLTGLWVVLLVSFAWVTGGVLLGFMPWNQFRLVSI